MESSKSQPLKKLKTKRLNTGSIRVKDVWARQASQLLELAEQSERIGEVRQAAIYRKHAMRLSRQ